MSAKVGILSVVIVLGRCLPKKNSSLGYFEYQQAQAMTRLIKNVVYAYVDNQSVKITRSIGKRVSSTNALTTYGYSFPIGGLPFFVVNRVKTIGLNSLTRQMKKAYGNIDSIIINYPTLTATIGWLEALHNAGIQIVCIEHWSQVNQEKLDKHRLAILKKAVEASSTFFCVSHDLKSSVERLVGGDHVAKLRVLPNMVDEKRFNLVDEVNRPAYTFLIAGRMVEGKLFDLAIDAFSQVVKDNDACLIIAGDGPLKKDLVRQVQSLGLIRQVDFLGWVPPDKMPDVYHAADCLLLTSVSETFAYPIAEAWMCGKPCIAPNNNPLRKYFNEDNGKTYSTGDCNSLAAAMTEMLITENCKSQEISDLASSLFSKRVVSQQLYDEIALCK